MGRAQLDSLEAVVFEGTMPERYRAAFDSNAKREHAAIVSRRAGAVAHVEIWKRLPAGAATLCIVADDRPGLLSLISAALVAWEMDVVSAQIYTRTIPHSGKAEAVDLVGVKRTFNGPQPLLSPDAAHVAGTLEELIAGRTTPEEVVRRARPSTGAATGSSTRVTFDENPREELAELTVETSDRPGLLLAISQALYRAQVQIIASDAKTVQGRVVDRFTIAELDGRPIRAESRGRVQMAVLSAIENLTRGSF
jgi:[protein-PII] uridylyltransferase